LAAAAVGEAAAAAAVADAAAAAAAAAAIAASTATEEATAAVFPDLPLPPVIQPQITDAAASSLYTLADLQAHETAVTELHAKVRMELVGILRDVSVCCLSLLCPR
jgi:hypothetical protein